MTIPRWSTIGLFGVLFTQIILSWIQARKAGKSFREVGVPTALMAGAVSMAFAREFFGELPAWIDGPLAILCFLLILMSLGLWLIQLKRNLKRAWRLEDENKK